MAEGYPSHVYYGGDGLVECTPHRNYEVGDIPAHAGNRTEERAYSPDLGDPRFGDLPNGWGFGQIPDVFVDPQSGGVMGEI